MAIRAAFCMIQGWYFPRVALYVFWQALESLSSASKLPSSSRNKAINTMKSKEMLIFSYPTF